jgi:hypothetical protein
LRFSLCFWRLRFCTVIRSRSAFVSCHITLHVQLPPGAPVRHVSRHRAESPGTVYARVPSASEAPVCCHDRNQPIWIYRATTPSDDHRDKCPDNHRPCSERPIKCAAWNRLYHRRSLVGIAPLHLADEVLRPVEPFDHRPAEPAFGNCTNLPRYGSNHLRNFDSAAGTLRWCTPRSWQSSDNALRPTGGDTHPIVFCIQPDCRQQPHSFKKCRVPARTGRAPPKLAALWARLMSSTCTHLCKHLIDT